MAAIVDERDQQFVLYEMLNLESLLNEPKFSEQSREIYDMTLNLAAKISIDECLPAFSEGDRVGAHLKDGKVTIPECYKKLHKIMNEAGLFTMHVPAEEGGLGFPTIMDVAVREHTVFNMGFTLYPEAAVGAGRLIQNFGTEEQKRKYMDQMFAGNWGGTMVLTEPAAGSDVGSLKTKAVRQPDGTFRIKGSKIFISGGDSDLFENIVHPVLARIEGDPEGTGGISIFLVPKYKVNDDGSLGERNDVEVTGVEDKMGLKGSATCAMSFGDNNECYAELLGEERTGMRIMFQMMNGARMGMGLQGLSTAAAAYGHALEYARDRVQGVEIQNMKNPEAEKVAIIKHPDVRRMLIWMKSQVEGLRSLMYFCAYAYDKTETTEGEDNVKWKGLLDFLVPILKAYGTDLGFKVTEQAIQIHGGYGYTKDYPLEQLMRDMKIGSIYEGTNGIQSLDLVGRKLSMNGGQPFKDLIAMMQESVTQAKAIPQLDELADDVAKAIGAMGQAGMYFAQCAGQGKLHTPVVKAYPFLNLCGVVSLGWFHIWQATIASKALGEIATAGGIEVGNGKALSKLAEENSEAAFYIGKISSAKYYIRNILPEAILLNKTIQNEDYSLLEIPEASF